MKKILLSTLAALALFSPPVLAQSTKVQLNTEINTLFPNNNSFQITPAQLRTVTLDIVNSIMPSAPVGSGNLSCFNGTTGLLKDCGLPVKIGLPTYITPEQSPYNAAGDCVTDDQAAITSAIAAAIAQNKALLFSSSCYAHSATLDFGFSNLQTLFRGSVTLFLTGASTVNVKIDAGPLNTQFLKNVQFGRNNPPFLKGNSTTTRNLFVRGVAGETWIEAKGLDAATTGVGMEIQAAVAPVLRLTYNANTSSGTPMATKPGTAISISERTSGEGCSACQIYLVIDGMTDGAAIYGNGNLIQGFSENNTGTGLTLGNAGPSNAVGNTIQGMDFEANGVNGLVLTGNTAENTIQGSGVSSAGAGHFLRIGGTNNTIIGGTYDTIVDTGTNTSLFSATYINSITITATTMWINLFNATSFSFSTNLNNASIGLLSLGNGILATNIVAPGVPAAGLTNVYVDSTNKVLSSKNDAGTVSSTVVPSVAVANQFMTGVSAAGVISRAQPAFTDISGTATVSQGGTGRGTLTNHGVLVGAGTGGFNATLGNAGSVLTGQGAAADPVFSSSPQLGGVGLGTGTMLFSGNTSGTVTMQPQAAAGTFNFNLPITAGGVGAVLTSQGGGGSAMSWTTLATVATSGSASDLASGTLPVARLGLSQITNSLGADVLLNNTGLYFDGPTIAQGTTGTWFASGTVTLTDTANTANATCKLWDGTTVISSTFVSIPFANGVVAVALSGYIASPVANIKISCKDSSLTTGKILFNLSSTSKDSTLSAFRIN